MKHLKLIITLFIFVVMLVILTGCGSEKEIAKVEDMKNYFNTKADEIYEKEMEEKKDMEERNEKLNSYNMSTRLEEASQKIQQRIEDLRPEYMKSVFKEEINKLNWNNDPKKEGLKLIYGTSDVDYDIRIESEKNKEIWSEGIFNVEDGIVTWKDSY